MDSRCKCGTEITAEEKDVGECVMMCKARGCETIWVRGFCSSSKVDADLPILTLLAWIMNLFLAIGYVTAVNPIPQNVAVLEHKI